MANESVEQAAISPELYGADPVHGNFTSDSSMHLWCANALASVVASDDAMGVWHDDIQEALKWLLSCEVSRARQAAAFESDRRRAKIEAERRAFIDSLPEPQA